MSVSDLATRRQSRIISVDFGFFRDELIRRAFWKINFVRAFPEFNLRLKDCKISDRDPCLKSWIWPVRIEVGRAPTSYLGRARFDYFVSYSREAVIDTVFLVRILKFDEGSMLIHLTRTVGKG